MSKSIRSYPKSQQHEVVSRRLKAETRGLGYWAAVDAQNRQGKVQIVTVLVPETEEEKT